jgi:hypothetical protein
VLEVVRFQIHAADSLIEGALQLVPLGDQVQSMRKSTGELVWDFIVLCNGRKAFKGSTNLTRSQTTVLMNR